MDAYGEDFAEDYLYFAQRAETATARLCGFLALADKES
jgi:hypothetical protein